MAIRKKTTKKAPTRKAKAEHITARSITLEDAHGKPRIFMDAGEGDGYATICLFGEGERSIQICTAANGGLHISLMGQNCSVSATLGMTEGDEAGISILDHTGRYGTVLGSTAKAGEHKLAMFRDGVQYWSSAPAAKS
ncbi:hypothetical protein BH09VER1_BH09VER1_44030 [soil metagenome]